MNHLSHSNPRVSFHGDQCAGLARVATAAIVILWSLPAVGQNTAARVKTFSTSAEQARTQTRKLEADRPKVISSSLVMNTVRQYPKKKELDGYLEQRAAEARAWEQKVAAGEARRTAALNPYNRSTYTKYYDDKGDWQFSVIENDYRATEKLQEDWNREYRRAQATLEGLRREYDSLLVESGLTAAQQSEIAGMLASAKERMGQFGTPPPELLPRPVEGDTNSPNPSFRAYDAITGKLIDIGSTGGGSRPVADEPPGGSRPADPPSGGGSGSSGGGGSGSGGAGGGPSLAGRTWNVTYPLTGPQRFPLAITLEAGGKATAYYGTRTQFHSPSLHEGTWSERGGTVTVVLRSSGRPGYSAYSEGFTVTGRLGGGGTLEATDVRRP